MDLKYAQYLIEKTKIDYNLISEDFSRKREKPWPEMKFLVDKFVLPEEKILDLGCGNGRLIEFLKEKNIDYLGIDNSERLVEIAKTKYPQYKFLVANALNLPLADNSFDKVFSIAVFHHIPSKKFRLLFLKEIKRVLRLGGLLVLATWYHWRSPHFIKLIMKSSLLKIFGKSKLDFNDILVPWHNKIERYTHCFTKRELKKLIEEAGLKLKEIGLLKRGDQNYNIYLVAEK